MLSHLKTLSSRTLERPARPSSKRTRPGRSKETSPWILVRKLPARRSDHQVSLDAFSASNVIRGAVIALVPIRPSRTRVDLLPGIYFSPTASPSPLIEAELKGSARALFSFEESLPDCSPRRSKIVGEQTVKLLTGAERQSEGQTARLGWKNRLDN